MTRLLTTLRWDLMRQFRYGFFYAGAFVVLVWLALLPWVTVTRLDLLLPAFLVFNAPITTFYFVAALVLLEKSEGTLQALVVSPLRASEYLAARCASLMLLVAVENLLILGLAFPLGQTLLALLPGLVALTLIYTLLGFVAIADYDSINEYLMPSFLYMILLQLPLLGYLGLVPAPLFWLHPVYPPLLLLRAALVPVPGWELAYALLGSLAWVGLTFAWSRRAFERVVTRTAGE
jgi:fluoroquinolone transport system permease protein